MKMWLVEQLSRPAMADQCERFLSASDQMAEGFIEKLEAKAKEEQEGQYEKHGSAAVVKITGLLDRYANLLSAYFGWSSYMGIANAVSKAAADPEVKSIVLGINSPGGFTDGVWIASQAIANVRTQKPVMAQIESMGASAAYWLGSQASRMFAEPMSSVGSIGVRMTLYDYSQMFKEFGIRAIPITTGKFKAAGAFGTEVTKEQEDYFQGLVDSTGRKFKQAVLQGRGERMTAAQLDKVADGRVFPEEQALKLKLIDGIRSANQTLAAVQ